MFGILSYKTWLIEPGFAQRMAPILFRSLQQGTLEDFFQKGQESNDKILSGLYNGIEADDTLEPEDKRTGPRVPVVTAKNGKKVAIVSMIGAITKNGDMCSYGMRSHQNSLVKIAKREDIHAVVLHFNNAPGGSVDGTPEISSVIAGLGKPTLSFVDGYAASAHYWMASQSKHIMMNKLTPSEVGSIGSLIVAHNVQNMIDAGEFPNTKIIRAPQSVNKALFNIVEPISDEMEAELKVELKEITKEFINNVKKGRAGKLSDDAGMFTGLMYGTDEAIKNGLADSKGSLQDAINKAAQLTASPSTSAPGKPAQVNTTMSFKSKVLSVIFGKSEKAAEETAEEQQASMQTADAQVAALELELQTLKELNTASSTKVTELESQVTELNTQVSTLTSEKETLSAEKVELQTKLDAAPTGKETTIIPGEKEGEQAADPKDVKKEKSFRSEADEEADKYVLASRATVK